MGLGEPLVGIMGCCARRRSRADGAGAGLRPGGQRLGSVAERWNVSQARCIVHTLLPLVGVIPARRVHDGVSTTVASSRAPLRRRIARIALQPDDRVAKTAIT